MRTSPYRVLLVLCASLLLCAVSAWASDFIGVYSIVDKVVLEPNESAPERIQIWGVFKLADGKPGDGLLPAQSGYLYYSLPSDARARTAALREWAELKKIAKTGEVVGFGSRYGSS